MAESTNLDQIFHIIMKRMVETFKEIGKTGPFWQKSR
jgi:hypothetical protein